MLYDVILCDPPWPFRVYSKKTGHGRSAESHYPTMTWDSMFSLPIADLLKPNGVAFVWFTNAGTPECLDLVRFGWELEFVTKAFTWAKFTKNGKDHFGMGYTTRQNTESLFLFKKPGGTPAYPNRAVREYQELSEDLEPISIEVPDFDDMELQKHMVMDHSAKPFAFRDLIKQLMGPKRNYLEIFARTHDTIYVPTEERDEITGYRIFEPKLQPKPHHPSYDGWDFMGNDVDGQDIRVQLPNTLREHGLWTPDQTERIRLNPTLTYGAVRSLQLGRATVVELPSSVNETKTALSKQLSVRRVPENNPFLKHLLSLIPMFEQSNWLKALVSELNKEPSLENPV